MYYDDLPPPLATSFEFPPRSADAGLTEHERMRRRHSRPAVQFTDEDEVAPPVDARNVPGGKISTFKTFYAMQGYDAAATELQLQRVRASDGCALDYCVTGCASVSPCCTHRARSCVGQSGSTRESTLWFESQAGYVLCRCCQSSRVRQLHRMARCCLLRCVCCSFRVVHRRR
jgi:hypothetical protein